jgi:DNA-binding LytR/AlgR family response regulator
VAYITKEENMSFIIRNDRLKLPVNLSLKQIQSYLPIKRFTLIDHNTFVNVSAIRKISRKNGKKILDLQPELNSVLEIHPNFEESFMTWLKENQA